MSLKNKSNKELNEYLLDCNNQLLRTTTNKKNSTSISSYLQRSIPKEIKKIETEIKARAIYSNSTQNHQYHCYSRKKLEPIFFKPPSVPSGETALREAGVSAATPN